MELVPGKPIEGYLTWNGVEYGSDTIVTEMLNSRIKPILEQVKERVGDYRSFLIEHINNSYKIGGTIIFPRHRNSFNQSRGMNRKICDRWDLTLECIRRYYVGEDSPLQKAIERDKDFFDLFVDFKGYVDYFFLQDCVDDDYGSVKLWCGDSFEEEK